MKINNDNQHSITEHRTRNMLINKYEFNGLSKAHERYRQTNNRQTDRQTDGRAIAYSERERELNVNCAHCPSFLIPQGASSGRRRQHWQERTVPWERRQQKTQERQVDWRSSCERSRRLRCSHRAACPAIPQTMSGGFAQWKQAAEC